MEDDAREASYRNVYRAFLRHGLTSLDALYLVELAKRAIGGKSSYPGGDSPDPPP
jgi:hypothetical protein